MTVVTPSMRRSFRRRAQTQLFNAYSLRTHADMPGVAVETRTTSFYFHSSSDLCFQSTSGILLAIGSPETTSTGSHVVLIFLVVLQPHLASRFGLIPSECRCFWLKTIDHSLTDRNQLSEN